MSLTISDLARVAARFVTRKRIDNVWRDDPSTVRQFAEEHGSEDVLLHPRTEMFYEEIGEAIRDQVHGAMLARYRDLSDGRDSPYMQEPPRSTPSTSEPEKPPWWQFWRRNE